MKTCITFCLLAALGAKLFGQTVVDLHPDYDAALGFHDGINTANTNYGTATQNAAFCIPGANGPGVNMNRALIHFDLSQFTPGTQIQSATLDLYGLGPSGILNGHTGSANATLVQQVTSPWQEMVVTWNTQPSVSNLNQVTLPVSSNPTQDYLGINVTSLVQDMINNPGTNYGLGLRLQNEAVTNALLFCSNDHPDMNRRPVLHVTLCEPNYHLIADYDAALGTHDGQNTANTNYGTAPQNAAYSITASNGTPSGNNNRALIHFDLSGIPTTATVTSAFVSLYARGQNGILNGHTGTANSCYLARVTAPWSDQTVTWNNQPATTLTDAATLLPSTGPLQDYFNIDVTAMVQDMVTNPSTNHGFQLSLINEQETNALIFQSLECGDSTKFPTLDVNILCGEVTAVAEEVSPMEMLVYPNPAHGQLRVNFNALKSGDLNMELIDLYGRKVATRHLENLSMGLHDLNLDQMIGGQASGIYILHAQMGESVADRKIILK